MSYLQKLRKKRTLGWLIVSLLFAMVVVSGYLMSHSMEAILKNPKIQYHILDDDNQGIINLTLSFDVKVVNHYFTFREETCIYNNIGYNVRISIDAKQGTFIDHNRYGTYDCMYSPRESIKPKTMYEDAIILYFGLSVGEFEFKITEYHFKLDTSNVVHLIISSLDPFLYEFK